MSKIVDRYKNYQAKLLFSDYYRPVCDNVMKVLEGYRDKNVAIWGADYKGAAFLKMVDPDEKYIKIVIDIAKEKCGTTVANRKVISCYDLKKYNLDVIFILNQRHFVQNYDIIKEQGVDSIVFDADEIVKRKLSYEAIMNREDRNNDIVENEKLMRKIQSELMPLLKEFKRICEKNHISYFLCAGSVLGAVRHKGFIPWDDDIDIGMLRSDYEKLIKIADEELSEGFLLMDGERSPNYYVTFAKVFRDHTALVVGTNSHLKLHHGFYLDIFPFDVIPDTEEAQNEFYWRQKEVREVYTRMKKKKKYEGRNPVKKFIANSEYYRLNLHSSKKMYQKVQSVMRCYEKENPKYIADLCAPYNKKLFFKYEDIFPTVDMEFEGEKYPIPGNYNVYLTTMYGDYMTLPPIEKRYVKHDIVEMSNTHNYEQDDIWLKKYYRKYGR